MKPNFLTDMLSMVADSAYANVQQLRNFFARLAVSN